MDGIHSTRKVSRWTIYGVISDTTGERQGAFLQLAWEGSEQEEEYRWFKLTQDQVEALEEKLSGLVAQEL